MLINAQTLVYARRTLSCVTHYGELCSLLHVLLRIIDSRILNFRIIKARYFKHAAVNAFLIEPIKIWKAMEISSISLVSLQPYFSLFIKLLHEARDAPTTWVN